MLSSKGLRAVLNAVNPHILSPAFDRSDVEEAAGESVPQIPIDSGLIFPFAGSVLVSGREQLLL